MGFVGSETHLLGTSPARAVRGGVSDLLFPRRGFCNERNWGRTLFKELK